MLYHPIGLTILFLSIIFSSTSIAQTSRVYQHYKMEYNMITNKNYVTDTINSNKFSIDYPYSRGPYGAHFKEGFIYVKTGDMKGLMSLKGKRLLDPCHFIRFHKKDSLISAFICSGMKWIYLNYQGDTISQGVGIKNNYCPSIKEELNPAYTHDRKTKTTSWGYLDKHAQWVIRPKYEEARPFHNGKAKVKINGAWGAIDIKGKIIILPSFSNLEDFKISQYSTTKKELLKVVLYNFAKPMPFL